MLPPHVLAQLEHVPPRHREDAYQEAWVAFLSGEDPVAAIWRYAKSEYRAERRGRVMIHDGNRGDVVIDRDGQKYQLSTDDGKIGSTVSARRRNRMTANNNR